MANTTGMKKWKLGLLVLGLVTLGLLAYVLIQGVGSKQDRATQRAAESIADKLNTYVNTNQRVPMSLSEAGITDVPSTISYTKLTSSSYKFCATYKASNIDVKWQVNQDLTRATSDRGLTDSSGISFNYIDSGARTELYLDGTHKAGEQCQTIKPFG